MANTLVRAGVCDGAAGPYPQQREEVARHFNNVARGWRKWSELGCGDCSMLWPECMVCHRIDTVTRVEHDSASGSAPMWQCSRCGAVTPERDIWEYETSLLLDVTERPDCSPLLLSLLERCSHLLFLFSQGETPNADAAGNAARQAARVLDQFGIDEDWFHLTDPRKSVLPDDVDATCRGRVTFGLSHSSCAKSPAMAANCSIAA